MSETEPIPTDEVGEIEEPADQPSEEPIIPEAPSSNPWLDVINAKKNKTPQFRPTETKPKENTRNPKLKTSKLY